MKVFFFGGGNRKEIDLMRKSQLYIKFEVENKNNNCLPVHISNHG